MIAMEVILFLDHIQLLVEVMEMLPTEVLEGEENMIKEALMVLVQPDKVMMEEKDFLITLLYL